MYETDKTFDFNPSYSSNRPTSEYISIYVHFIHYSVIGRICLIQQRYHLQYEMIVEFHQKKKRNLPILFQSCDLSHNTWFKCANLRICLFNDSLLFKNRWSIKYFIFIACETDLMSNSQLIYTIQLKGPILHELLDETNFV